jgi:hypothetical protein
MQVTLTVPTVSEFVDWCWQCDFGLANGVILYMAMSYVAMLVVVVLWRLDWLDDQKKRRLAGLSPDGPVEFWVPATMFWLLSPIIVLVLSPSFVILVCSAPFVWWRNRHNG